MRTFSSLLLIAGIVSQAGSAQPPAVPSAVPPELPSGRGRPTIVSPLNRITPAYICSGTVRVKRGPVMGDPEPIEFTISRQADGKLIYGGANALNQRYTYELVDMGDGWRQLKSVGVRADYQPSADQVYADMAKGGGTSPSIHRQTGEFKASDTYYSMGMRVERFYAATCAGGLA